MLATWPMKPMQPLKNIALSQRSHVLECHKPILRVIIAKPPGYVYRERRFFDNAPATLTSESNAVYR
jgi:hypothetical protein